MLCTVSPTGTKSLVLRTRKGARSPIRRAIGIHGQVTLEQARRTARDWLEVLSKGGDVGITKREFCREVFNSNNIIKIRDFVPKKGKLNLHLLAKPKDNNAGFYRSSKRSLLWTEMFLLMLCRKKNPNILNIVGHAFLEDCAVESITCPSKGRGKTIRTFRSALGFGNSGMAGGNGHKKRLITIKGAGPIKKQQAAPAAPSAAQPAQLAQQPTQPKVSSEL